MISQRERTECQPRRLDVLQEDEYMMLHNINTFCPAKNFTGLGQFSGRYRRCLNGILETKEPYFTAPRVDQSLLIPDTGDSKEDSGKSASQVVLRCLKRITMPQYL